MRHTHQKQIDGITWTVNDFSATEGLRLLTRLTNLCGGPLGKAVQALPRDRSVLDAELLSVDLLGAAVSELAGRLDENEIVELVRRILGCTLADGKEASPQFDILFQGRYGTLFKVVLFALESNYRVPLSEWAGAALVASIPPQEVAAAQ